MSETQTQNPIGEILVELRKELNALATDDISSVLKNVEKAIVDKVTEQPYMTLAAAVGIGYGLSALSGAHYKQAAFRLGKLMALKALSSIDAAPVTQGEENGQQSQTA